jgi:hypothetical protein
VVFDRGEVGAGLLDLARNIRIVIVPKLSGPRVTQIRIGISGLRPSPTVARTSLDLGQYSMRNPNDYPFEMILSR